MLIRVEIIHFKNFHGNSQFTVRFQNFNTHYKDSETSLKNNYSSDRAFFDWNKRFMV